MFIESSVHFLQQVINCSDPVMNLLVDYMDVVKFLSLVSLHFDIIS